MEEQSNGDKGMLDRVLREALRTPKFKATLNVMLSSLDSKSTASLVRTLFWTDPGVILSLVGSLPTIINMLVEWLRETLEQFNGFPRPTMLDLMESLVVGINGAPIGEAAANISVLAKKFESEDAAKLKMAGQNLAADLNKGHREKMGLPADAPLTIERWIGGVTARAKDPDSLTSTLIRTTAEAMQNNPDFAIYVMRPLLESVFAAQFEGGTGQ